MSETRNSNGSETASASAKVATTADAADAHAGKTMLAPAAVASTDEGANAAPSTNITEDANISAEVGRAGDNLTANSSVESGSPLETTVVTTAVLDPIPNVTTTSAAVTSNMATMSYPAEASTLGSATLSTTLNASTADAVPVVSTAVDGSAANGSGVSTVYAPVSVAENESIAVGAVPEAVSSSSHSQPLADPKRETIVATESAPATADATADLNATALAAAPTTGSVTTIGSKVNLVAALRFANGTLSGNEGDSSSNLILGMQEAAKGGVDSPGIATAPPAPMIEVNATQLASAAVPQSDSMPSVSTYDSAVASVTTSDALSATSVATVVGFVDAGAGKNATWVTGIALDAPAVVSAPNATPSSTTQASAQPYDPLVAPQATAETSQPQVVNATMEPVKATIEPVKATIELEAGLEADGGNGGNTSTSAGVAGSDPQCRAWCDARFRKHCSNLLCAHCQFCLAPTPDAGTTDNATAATGTALTPPQPSPRPVPAVTGSILSPAPTYADFVNASVALANTPSPAATKAQAASPPDSKASAEDPLLLRGAGTGASTEASPATSATDMATGAALPGVGPAVPETPTSTPTPTPTPAPRLPSLTLHAATRPRMLP
uniref:Uncharacterized protein n=1 Tax=Chrysotila carterae TaxID=13221 RepID=A0A7S4BCN4_CHRCT